MAFEFESDIVEGNCFHFPLGGSHELPILSIELGDPQAVDPNRSRALLARICEWPIGDHRQSQTESWLSG